MSLSGADLLGLDRLRSDFDRWSTDLGRLSDDATRGAQSLQELWQGADPVRLTATETTLMRIFAATPHEPVSRATLVEKLGRNVEGDATSERAVDVQVTRLRRKLEPDPKQPRYLQTVRGEGYMLAPDRPAG